MILHDEAASYNTEHRIAEPKAAFLSSSHYNVQLESPRMTALETRHSKHYRAHIQPHQKNMQFSLCHQRSVFRDLTLLRRCQIKTNPVYAQSHSLFFPQNVTLILFLDPSTLVYSHTSCMALGMAMTMASCSITLFQSETTQQLCNGLLQHFVKPIRFPI